MRAKVHYYCHYTGRSNEDVVENLFKLVNAVGCEKVCIRVPRIPNFNTDEDVNKSVDYIRRMLCIEPEVFSYVIEKNQEFVPHNPHIMGADYVQDRSYQDFIQIILSDKEEFLGHTRDYLKEDGTSERISWAVSCYRNLFCEMYVYAQTKKYDCTSGDIQRIIDEYINEIDKVEDDPMMGYSFRIHIKERIRARFGCIV